MQNHWPRFFLLTMTLGGLSAGLGAADFAAEPAAQVGQLAPDLRLTRLDGSPVALADFRGKRVLIDSWASW